MPIASGKFGEALRAAFRGNLQESQKRQFPDASWAEQLIKLATNQTFKAWLDDRCSQFLVVRHEATLTRNDIHSPLSYVSVALGDKEEKGELLRRITFCCGQNRQEIGFQDPSQLIMREITYQMANFLGVYWINRVGCDYIAFRRELKEKNPDVILTALRMVQWRTGWSTIYVIIDGLYHYQGTPFEEEANKLIKCLNDLVNELPTSGLPRIKVLITNPTREQQQSWGFEAATIEL
ncbi:hypothetical protein HDV57DRAFT_520200 [Trichoderma longibrachiatum]|uniref:Uncharacterized protein n=1 Tax=Trichoderma longibrachiatum ATCC 18648 TaxID=983965 RepID=A0A2T4BTQ8_TRILO|nr:hypothetical protein M440DRAFT_7748 [Trichoderma longibrachiatum ATCC 18648]